MILRIFAFLSLFPGVHFAQEYCIEQVLAASPSESCEPYSTETMRACKIPCDGDEWDYFFLADWLYWKPFSEGYEYALVNQQNFITTTSNRFYINQKPLDLQFSFSSNYRLIGGSYLPEDQQHIILKFTHLSDSTSTSKAAYGEIPVTDQGSLGIQIYRTWTLGSDSFLNPGILTASKSIKYMVGDIEFGKLIWGQDPISLTAQIGVRAVDLKNELSIYFQTTPGLTPTYTLSGVSEMKIRNKYSGAGVRLGTSMNFRLYGNFFWINEFDGALILGKFKTSQREVYNDTISNLNPPPNPPVPIVAKSSLSQMSLKPNIQLSTSLGYAFTGYNHEISLKAGYELDYWINMNQLTRFVSEGMEGVLGEFFYVREKGDVYFHGVYGEAGISF